MKYQHSACLALLSSLFVASTLKCAAAPAAPRTAVSEEVVGKDVEVLERRFFPKTYWNDPLEKRLERLELMIYGSTQSGSIGERLDRIKKDVVQRSKTTPNSGGVTRPAPAPGKAQGDSAAGGQYPVLNTLEWRALKKTFPTESLDQRLARLESHLFGQPSSTMPYIDRIERLKRVMGLGMTSDLPPGGTLLGPSPRARARVPFNGSGMPLSPFFPDASGDDFPGLDSDSSKSLAEIMKRMRQHMSEMQRMAPGAAIRNWRYDPQTGTWIEQGTGRRFRGDGRGLHMEEEQSPQVPPYLDPNSI